MGRVRDSRRAASGSARDRDPAAYAAPVSRHPRTPPAADGRNRDRRHRGAAARETLRFLRCGPRHERLAADGATDSFGMNGGMITKRRLLSLEGALAKSGPTLFDALLSVAPPRPQG